MYIPSGSEDPDSADEEEMDEAMSDQVRDLSIAAEDVRDDNTNEIVVKSRTLVSALAEAALEVRAEIRTATQAVLKDRPLSQTEMTGPLLINQLR